MTTAWPQVVARTVVLFQSVTTAPVYDGPPVTSAAPPDYVTVGYVEDDAAGTYSSEAIYDGSLSQETGTVVSQIVAQSGDTNLAACRARAFAIEHATAGRREGRSHARGPVPDGTSTSDHRHPVGAEPERISGLAGLDLRLHNHLLKGSP
jgi:hypothetical protein